MKNISSKTTVHFYIDMVYLKAVKYIFNSRMRDRNNMKEA